MVTEVIWLLEKNPKVFRKELLAMNQPLTVFWNLPAAEVLEKLLTVVQIKAIEVKSILGQVTTFTLYLPSATQLSICGVVELFSVSGTFSAIKGI
jgi:hypothetical protein